MVSCCLILTMKFVQQLNFLEHHLSFRSVMHAPSKVFVDVDKYLCRLLTWGWFAKELHLVVHLCTFFFPFWVWHFVDTLKLTKSRHMSKFDHVIIIDFDSIDVCDVKYLPPSFDNVRLFVLHHVAMGFPNAFGQFMNGMDKMCDIHPWYTTKTTNIQNNFGLSFKCSSYIGQLQCKVETKYHIIHSWWLSSGVATKQGILWSLLMVGVPLHAMGRSHDYWKDIALYFALFFNSECVCVCVWCIVICVMIAWYNYGRTWRMPTCSLLKIMHDKWLQQSGNKTTCMYEAIAGSVICAFMHIANYMMCLKGGSTSKRCDTIPLRLKVTTKNKDPKLLADAMKFYQGQKILTLWIVSWRGPSSLGTPNKNLPCLGELIVTHIDQTNWIVSFISLTHENLSTHKE